MEVKPGYKQTEVGVVPEAWRAEPLKGKLDISHGFAFQSQYFVGHGPYLLTTPGHFHEEGGFRDIGEKQKYYDGPVPPGYVLQSGDMIVAMTEQADGLLGSAALIPSASGYLHNQRLGRVRPITPEVDVGFLFYLFNSPSYRAKVRETAAGTKVKHTSPQKLLEINVALPTIPEQRAIAAALVDVDGLIDSLERLIVKKRDLMQAAMQQLLTGKTRLPGFTGDWALRRLGQIARIEIGRTPSRLNPAYWGRGYPWLSIADLKSKFLEESSEEITERAASQMTIIPRGILLMSFKLSIGRLGITARELFTNEAICNFQKLQANPEFLYYALGRIDFAVYGKQAVKGYILNKASLKLVEVSLPEPLEQAAIAQVLSDMDAEITAIEDRRDKTRLLKEGMMQELLTGQTRLV